MTVVKTWVNAGQYMTDTTEHDMRQWAQSMDWIVQNIFNTPPLLVGHQGIQKQVSNPQLTWLREVCLQADRDEKLDFDLLAHNIAELCEHADIEYPNKRKYHDEETAFRYIGIIMCKIFNMQDSVIIDSYQVTRSEKEKYKEKIKEHRMSKVYEIKMLHAETTLDQPTINPTKW